MPVFGGSDHGDLYIEYNVVLPKSLSSEKQKSESMRHSSSGSPFSPFNRAGRGLLWRRRKARTRANEEQGRALRLSWDYIDYITLFIAIRNGILWNDSRMA